MKKIILRLYKNGKIIRRYSQTKITNKIWSIISLKVFDKAYVRVSYGIKENVLCKREMFYNDAWKDNKKDLIDIIKDFWKEV